MSDISEVLSALKRGDLAIEEIIAELTNSLQTTKKNLSDLKNPIQELIEYERKLNDEISKFESSNLSLSQEITSLKKEKVTNEQLLRETQEKYTTRTEKRTNLEKQVRDVQAELANTERTLESTKNELDTKTTQKEQIEAEISTIVEDADHKILEIEKQIAQEEDILSKVKGERMALEYLIKRNHIEFNELKIINSLDGRTSTDIGTIAKVTGLSNSLIEKTLEGLMKRNLLTYDSTTGAIKVTGNLKL